MDGEVISDASADASDKPTDADADADVTADRRHQSALPPSVGRAPSIGRAGSLYRVGLIRLSFILLAEESDEKRSALL